MVYIEDYSVDENCKAKSESISESEDEDESANKKSIKKKNENLKDTCSKVDKSNVNSASGDSIFNCPSTNLSGGIEQLINMVKKDSQSTSRNMELAEFFPLIKNGCDNDKVDKDSKKWDVTSRFPTDRENKFIYSSKRKKSRDKMKHFQMEIFFASVIEMLSDGEFEGLNIHFRKVLRHVAGHFIHSSYFSEDYGAFRIAIRKRIRETLNAATNLRIENGLTVNTAEKRKHFSSSRYSVDFKEIRKIGHGGFGEVFHVHSNIDDCDYAIKKIHFNLTMAEPMRIINEVRLLAAVQHKNIVRYYGAWVELQDLQASVENDEYVNEREEVAWKNSSEEGRKSISSSTNSYSYFTQMDESDHLEEQSSSVPIKQGRFWAQGSSTTSSSAVSENYEMHQDITANQGLTVARGNLRTDPVNLMLPHMGIAVMFVQMELCSGTLADYFAERNAEIKPKVDRQMNRKIMEQLMSAVTHLHSKKIIHRDIKPSNIFLRYGSSSPIPSVLLGDFGLACLHQTDIVHDTIVVKSMITTLHSVGIGTSIYAAPEQQNSAIYDNAVDVYSAGIVFFELYVPFRTQVERLKAIGKLRKGKLSKEFETCFPDEGKLIKEMCKENPKERIHAFEVVAKLDKLGENVEFLRNRIQELEKEIVRLKNLILENNIKEI